MIVFFPFHYHFSERLLIFRLSWLCRILMQGFSGKYLFMREKEDFSEKVGTLPCSGIMRQQPSLRKKQVGFSRL